MNKKHCQDAHQYALDIIGGEIPACKYVRLSCQRFLDDLERDDLVFDEVAAQRACNFIENLPHTKGKWFNKRELLRLEPWQKFIICNIFGWHWADGRRRFREAYNEIPRKNGKSQLGAGIGLYMFVADGEGGAEVYSGATTEQQAWEVFRPAKQMVDRTPDLKNHYDIESNAKTLVVLSQGARFAPLIGKPGDGASPNCAIVDEYHEHDSDDLYDTMMTGMGARENPLMLVITTAGSNLGGPCYEKRGDCIKVLEKTVEDDAVFAIIFGIDAEDEWDTEDALIKANPNYGVSVNADFLKGQLVQARRSASKQNAYRTKHLNQWVGARTAWMNMLAWQKQKRAISLDDFVGEPCFGGLDLASKKDVAAFVLLFPRDGKYHTFQKFYAPESAAEENDKYRDFATAGLLTLTPGSMTDYAFIEADILAACEKFDLQQLAFDPFQAHYLITRLMETSAPCVEYGNTVKNMSDPMKEVEAQILSGQLVHDGNDLMTWMMGNVTARIDAKDNIFPRKEREADPRCKIDGVVALIMAMGLAMKHEEEADSYTLSHGLVSL